MDQQSIAHYRITGKIGEGGMGAVYRATDTKLHREVAIKVIPDQYAQDPDRLARFTREAQVLASLNHVNIATIFGIEERAIVMELIEGPTLADRIAQGAIPVEEALGIARQIAEALEAAHEKDVIHRDLKPANIKVTPGGTVKVLDFGLAKLADAREPGDLPASAPTVVRGQSPTLAGIIMGTAEYMSPEQAAGKPVDRRTDIWAFGVVLWEMLTGQRMFAGETVSHTLADVLRAPIEFDKLPESLPARIGELIRRCLERDAKTRLRDIGEARITIQRYLANPTAGTETAAVTVPTRAGRPVLPWALAALLTPVAGGVGWMMRPAPVEPALPVKFQLRSPEGVRFTDMGHSVSPDGRHLLLVANPPGGRRGDYVLFLRNLAETTYRELPDSGGAFVQAWSPDSKSILFTQNGKWRRMDVGSGIAMTLCDHSGPQRGGAWNEQGTLLISRDGVLQRIPASGGNPAQVTSLDASRKEILHAFPEFLPGGRFFLYVATSSARGEGSLWLGDLEGKEAPKRLLESVSGQVKFAGGTSTDTGFLLFRRGNGMVGSRFDVRRRVITDDPVPILERVPYIAAGRLAVAVSKPARVMAWSEEQARDLEELCLIDRQGKKVTSLAGPGEGSFGHLEFSPDGKTLMGSRVGADATRELWRIDLGRGAISRVTFTGGTDKAQAWSPDSRRVFYMSMGVAEPGIYVTQADGTGKPELLLKTPGHHIAASPDGRHVAFEGRSEGASRPIYLLDVNKPGKADALITGSAVYSWPQFSPDGRWLAYVSTETGRQEVYVQSFPPGNGKWQVSRNGGRLARWRRDGKELVFVEGDGETRFYSVAVRQKGAGLEFDNPALMFDVALVARSGSNYFALSPDGQRIALNLTPPTATGTQVAVQLDWMPGLKR